EDQLKIARAFTLLLDLINICETSYRTWRLQQKPTLKPLAKKALLNLVLRTYSVEIRSPLFIDLLRQLSDLLIWGLQSNFDLDHMAIRSKLRFLWQVPLAPGRKLSLRNEAEYNYSLILKQPILDFLLREYPSYQLKLSSWTGGDRRNWPQLDETGMLDCFRMSRGILLADIREKLGELASDLKKMGRSTDLIGLIKQDCQKLEVLTKGDGARVLAFKARFEKLLEDADVYLREHENVYLIKRLFVLFPALVVPISLRERPKLMREALNNSRHTFSRILKMLKAISLGCDPSGFVKSLVISPCESVGDLNTAKELIQKYWDASLLPLSPSFEDRESLSHSKKILSQWLDQGGMEDLVRGAWSNKMEIYLAYSDSSINIGSLPSRRLLQKSMYSLESTMKSRKIESIFFHGEGGELLRGGGALRDQISWWTSGAIRRPKISLQGEMISRVFSTEEVLNSWALHLSKELQLSQARRDKSIKSTVFDQFCQLAEESFKQRPRIEMKSGRSLDLLMREDFCNGNDILLSTQTRNLIIAWWGLGSAWASLKSDQKTEIQRIFQENSFFSSFVKRLAFALSKVEPEIWKLYLNSQFPKEGEQHFKQFVDEFKKSKKFVFEVSGEKSLLWFRPWLEESIRLRSAYIHPLNLLQLIALEHKKEDLLRTTLIGISSGMMTTG
ncbi:MAG: phosphoenolpyruvate carboxylase, partial [Bdellovibrionales bacterium]|nr:phosphoenolpyruvate carboxylase [Bdellovibrionales bacterium]